eukprot:scaffold446544_cov20-Prasinocladus_malaysianus.AAC.1
MVPGMVISVGLQDQSIQEIAYNLLTSFLPQTRDMLLSCVVKYRHPFQRTSTADDVNMTQKRLCGLDASISLRLQTDAYIRDLMNANP